MNNNKNPYADIITYCLMPNHFHLMLVVNSCVHTVSIDGITKKRDLNNSIGIMLRSYTRSINKEFGFSGKLFREGTKAICLNGSETLTKSSFLTDQGTIINYELPENQYPQLCHNYIHHNPVKAGLVRNSLKWEFSSAKEYSGIEQNGLINMKIAEKYIFLTPSVLTVSP